ncbi:MAG: Glucokinase [Verrucomicrobiae bacterium]|nr:Glucokinase [Verrucomicrobiae bacterium]
MKKRHHILGVDLGGTKILAAVFDERGRLLSREKKATKPELGTATVINRVEECVHEALAAAAIPHTEIAALGIGVPGPIDPKGEIVRVAPNLHWKDVPLARLLRKHLDVPVTVVNDVQAGTMAVAALGAGRKLKDFACMFVGTGLGGGIVINGELYKGSTGMAGEVGHMVVVPDDGPKCGCGNRGCLEAVASRSAIVRRIVNEIEDGRKSVVKQLCDGDLKRIRSRILATAYRDGDELVREVLHAAADYIGIGAANLINVLNPQAVILGGGVIEALGDRLLPRITKSAWAHVIAPTPQRVNIKDSGLGDDAGILGAALAARQLVG